MPGIAALLLSNLPALVGGAASAWRLVSGARDIAKQSQAWTPEQEKEFSELQAKLFEQPHWKDKTGFRPGLPAEAGK